MYESARSRILDNSAVFRLFCQVASGSLFLKYVPILVAALRRLGNRLSGMIEGSRCAAFFKVEDYLEADSSNLVAAVRKAVTYQWSNRILCSLRDWLLACLQNRFSRNSTVNSLAKRLINRQSVLLTRSSLMIFVLIFLGVFYSFRLLLVNLVPESEFYLTWSTGLILALLLIGLLTRLIPEKSEESGNGGAAGVLENTGKVIRRTVKLITSRRDR